MIWHHGRHRIATETNHPMSEPVDDVRTIDELRQFVHETLCAKENLVANEFAMTEVRLTRAGELCGLQFCVRGPRSVRLAAIWAADRNTIYLYDAKGQRYSKIPLTRQIGQARQAPAA
jgi:hypothetical protein